MTENDILQRVRKLLDLAEHANTPEAERDLAIQRAQGLMLKHAIDEAMVKRDPKLERAKPIVKNIMYAEGKGYHQAKVDLLSAVARNNRCKVVYYTARQTPGKQAKYADIVGFPDDVAFVEMLYTSLWLQLIEAGTKAHKQLNLEWDDEKDKFVKPHGKTFIAAFAEGFIYQVSQRMREANRNATREAEQVTTGSELALIDRKKQVDLFYEGRYSDLGRMSRSRNRGNSQGWSSGSEAGKRANIGQSGLSRGAKALPRG
jgi:Protein of unknown function (DUF2786)